MKAIKTVIITLIILIIFYFLIRTLYSSWTKITEANIRIEVEYIVLSILFLMLGSFSCCYAWYILIKSLNQKMTYWQGLKTIATSQFGKYIPGKIWAIGGRVLLSKRYGVDEVISTTAVLIETLYYLSSTIILFILSLGFNKHVAIPPGIYFVIFLIISVNIIVVAYPRILGLVLNISAKIIKKKITPLELKPLKLVEIYFLYFISWVLHSLGFFFIARAVYTVSFSNILGIMGSYSISWALSFLIFLIPGGFGIREGFMTFFFKSFMPLPIATLMAFVARLWTTFGEISLFLISLLKKQ